MSPFAMTGFGMALAWAGYDVDLIPYGQPVTAEDLAGVDLVVALQVYRLLAQRMAQAGMDYPFHLGVTEAGEGEEARIKSAIGIGVAAGIAMYDWHARAGRRSRRS